MLKRADLTKQLELVIQQEIKNYNDSLSSVYQEINSLKEKTDAVEKHSLESDADLLSKQKNLQIDIENIKAVISENTKNIQRHFRDQSLINETLTKDLLAISEAAKNRLKEQDQFKSTINSVSKHLENVQESALNAVKETKNDLVFFQNKINQQLLKTYLDIVERPSEVPLIRKQLEAKITSYAIDAQGILKEIRVHNKATFILEKKIENIYLLLQRLEKRLEDLEAI